MRLQHYMLINQPPTNPDENTFKRPSPLRLSTRSTSPQHNTLVFHRTKYSSPTCINLPLPRSPSEFNTELSIRTKSERGTLRVNTVSGFRNHREQELSDSSPGHSPTSPPPGEYLPPWSRRSSFATCSSRDSSTGLVTPPLNQSPRLLPVESPYLDAPFIPASPVLSYRGAYHKEPCFDRILERRSELEQQRRQAYYDSQRTTPEFEMANAALKRKIVILGSPSVGKTSITQQYVTPPTYNEQYYPTIESTSNKIVTHKGVQYDCEIVDTAGQDEFSLFPAKYAAGVHGYVLVYSITSRQSFDMIASLHEKILDQSGLEKVPCVIVGQKTDLEKERRVTKAEGEALAKKLGAAFLESSAKDNKNVERAFEALLGEMQREYNPAAPAPASRWWPWR